MALNFQQRSSVFLRRVLLVAFLVASLALVTLYSREGQDGPLHAVQSGVSGAVAPLKFVGAAASAGVNDAAEGFGNLTADESTLSGLRESNAELRELLSQADEYKQEAQRLQKLLELKDLYEIDGVGARVIGNPDQAWSQAVTIDKGTADGVETGLTVMGTSGVVGQVYSAGEHTAEVRLLTDPDSGAAAPESGSVSRRTSAVCSPALYTWPTTPEVPMTVRPVSTPSAVPLSMVTAWLHAWSGLPMTRAPTPSIS